MAERIEKALLQAGSSGESVGLLMLDLNRFKEINDTLGHHFGDLLLQQVASRLTSVVTGRATVARLGGDEFAVLLPGVDTPELVRAAEQALAAIQLPASLDGTIVDVGGSIGAALYPTNSGDAAELFQHADIAMYTAKRGNLGVAMYDASADDHNSVKLLLQGKLHRAIDERELVLHYQPKRETRTGQICGVEALDVGLGLDLGEQAVGTCGPDRIVARAAPDHAELAATGQPPGDEQLTRPASGDVPADPPTGSGIHAMLLTCMLVTLE